MRVTLPMLKFLRAAEGVLTPETQLRDDIRMAVAPPPTKSEVDAALNRMEDRGWAVSVRDEITQVVRWRITDAGKAELAARNL